MYYPSHPQFNRLFTSIRPYIETQYGVFGLGLCLGLATYIHVWGTVIICWILYSSYQFTHVENRLQQQTDEKKGQQHPVNTTATASISLHRHYAGDTTNEHEMVDAVIDYVCHLDSSKSLMYTRQFHLDTNEVISVDPTLRLYIQLIDKEFDKRTGIIHRMTLCLYSSQLTLTELRNWLERIHGDYQQKHKDQLETKMYFFEEVPPAITHDIQGNIQWSSVPKRITFSMNEFHTHKNFKTVFGKEVQQVKQRMDLFLYNKEFYERRGKPHTLGLLLYGRPGCGKTSLIKAILKETGRHGITLKLKDYTTETQLDNLFHTETLLTVDPISGTSTPVRIPLNKRVYIIEDVDCLSTVVQQRPEHEASGWLGISHSQPVPPSQTHSDIILSQPTKVDPNTLLTLMSEEHLPVLKQLIELVSIGNGCDADYVKTEIPNMDSLFCFGSAVHIEDNNPTDNQLFFTHTANRYDASGFGGEFQELTLDERLSEVASTADKPTRNIFTLFETRSKQDDDMEETMRPLSPSTFQRMFEEELKRRTEEQLNETSCLQYPTTTYTYGEAIDMLTTMLDNRKYVDYHFTAKQKELLGLLDQIERDHFIFLERNYDSKFVFVRRERKPSVGISPIQVQTQLPRHVSAPNIEDCPLFQPDTVIVDPIAEKVKQQQTANGRGITLSYLLNLLDGIHEGDSRILIMTSNRPDVLDKALLRSGRIDLKIEFGYATLSVVREMFTNYFQHCPEASEWVSKILPAIDSRMSPADVSEVFDRFWDQPAKAVEYLNHMF